MKRGEREQEAVVRFLADPATHAGAAVDRLSTHAAHIFLAGPLAYKLKRAVKFPFLDFSTVDRRRCMLEEELNLNRRWAPGLYLDVRPLCRDRAGRISFNGEGAVVDWVLVMRRFPQDALLDTLAAQHRLPQGCAVALADRIAAMHRDAPRALRPAAAAFAADARDDLAPLRAVPDLPWRALTAAMDAALDGVGALLDRRAAAGFVRRCHGDLHLGNIVMIDGLPTPFDALEFDPALATGDVFYDLAFVLMDLDHRGLTDAANAVLNRYLQVTNDIEGLRGLPLFLGVRAAIRAKVAALAAAQSKGEKRAEAEARARSYAALALRYLTPAPPVLVAIGGLSGTGKSVLGKALAPALAPRPGAAVLRSDLIRKRLHGVAETDHLPAEASTAESSKRVYATLYDDARRAMAAGWSVVADAVFASGDERRMIEQAAGGARFVGLWLEAPLQERLARVGARRNDASDADAAVVQVQENYEIADLTWRRCEAGGAAAATLARAAAILSDAAPGAIPAG